MTEVHYRPSHVSRIRQIASDLSSKAQRRAYDLASGTKNVNAFAGKNKIRQDEWPRTLDLASAYLHYLAIGRIVGRDAYLKRFQTMSQARSGINPPVEHLIEKPSPVRPDQGHLPGRIGFGSGCRTDTCFSEISLRLGYHDFLDHDAGYIKETQINFMNTIIRYERQDRRFNLYSLRIFEIASLAPRDMFFKPLAWKTSLGVTQKILASGKKRLITDFSLGAGRVVSIGPALVYLLAEIELNASRSFDDNVILGAGASTGILTSLTAWWKIHCSLRNIRPLLGEPYPILRAEVAQSFTMSKNSSISAHVLREKIMGSDRSEVKMAWNIYF